MPCTTFLAGKKATIDGSTLISRTDDGFFDVKKTVVVLPKDQPRTYKSKISHVRVELPDDPMRYTASPSVDPHDGTWAATGINEAGVGMTATETITSNPRVLGADPLVVYEKARGKKPERPGGIGEEDFVVLVLPYIRSAREGVLRLGSLLEQYGTYESNGIAFSDCDEVWWMETIGGHHWIARRVRDEEYVIMPNQFGLDRFDLADAKKDGRENLCSADLEAFIAEYRLDGNNDGAFNPRLIFGSHEDSDHVYNTPRAWYMARYFNPTSCRWTGPDADYTPESDNIPWSWVPERKITVEDVKTVLSSYYQGTPYDPYGRGSSPDKGRYRPIGISRTGVTGILQIKDGANGPQGIEWIAYGSNAFNACIPLYTDTDSLPDYVSRVSLDVDVRNFYWASRLIGLLVDAHYSSCQQMLERYQQQILTESRKFLNEYDRKIASSKDKDTVRKYCAEANSAICDMAREKTGQFLRKLVLKASEGMKNGYNRFDP